VSPATTKNFQTAAFSLRPDQIARIEMVQERLQGMEPNRSVSRSDVFREVFDRGLPIFEAEIEAAEGAT
jgi:hypothetical protein